ncbi:hypothetical protein AOLI_G00280060 [Acnodon oligacanthus]
MDKPVPCAMTSDSALQSEWLNSSGVKDRVNPEPGSERAPSAETNRLPASSSNSYGAVAWHCVTAQRSQSQLHIAYAAAQAAPISKEMLEEAWPGQGRVISP